jgi:hypothetical protein
MLIRSCALAFTLAATLICATGASAFFGASTNRPPPNGMNGLSPTGFSVNGFTADATTIKAVILEDGVRVVLK